MAMYEFAIQKETLANGSILCTPVCRKRPKFLGRLEVFANPWERITKIYDTYILMDLPFAPKLTYVECEEHIREYKAILQKQSETDVVQVEYHSLEEKEL